jgi:hypothetical protein
LEDGNLGIKVIKSYLRDVLQKLGKLLSRLEMFKVLLAA